MQPLLFDISLSPSSFAFSGFSLRTTEEEERSPELHGAVIVPGQVLMDAATWGSKLCGC